MNIVGEGFPKEIIKQIYNRQKAYGSGYSNIKTRTPEEILYLNANSSWCKLISSTYIENIDIINNPTIKSLNLSGDLLARQFILFNGTANDQGLGLREGIDLTNSLSGNNKAYGIGGTEFGIRPMMGIQTVSVTHENRGSLRQASVKLKAWNRTQFEIIDVLYLRLGFSVLLEWGNSMYFDNNYVLQTKPNNSLANEFLDGNLSYKEFLSLIEKTRLDSLGNYDAMFAKVKNFSWSFQKDGSYDITLDLISSGDVIESLKINTIIEDPLQTVNANENEPKPDTENDDDFIEFYAKKSSIGQFLYYLRYQLDGAVGEGVGGKSFGNIPGNRVSLFSFSDVKKSTQATNIQIESLNTIRKINAPFLYLFDNIFDTNLTGTELALPLDISPQMFEVYDTEGKPLKVIDAIGYPWDDKPGDDEMYYVRFGTFLAFIQNYLMPRYIKKDKTDGDPMLNVDYDQNTNLMYAYRWQVTVDPRLCIVGRTIPIITGLIFDEYKLVDFQTDCSPFINDKFNDIAKGVEYGNIMNIYINMRFILEKIDSLKDDKNKVSLFDLLKGICEGINEGLGGLNSLEPIIDEITNSIKIIDANPLPNRDKVLERIKSFPLYSPLEINTELVSFDLYGYKTDSTPESAPIYNGLGHASFIKDFSFATEITPELATMVTVGAAANGSVVGENQTALSKLNVGLYDRYKKEILDIYEIEKRKKEQTEGLENKLEEEKIELKNLYERYKETLKDYFDFLEELSDSPPEILAGEPTLNVDDVDAHKGVLLNIFQYEEQIKNKIQNLKSIKQEIENVNNPNTSTQTNLQTGTGFIPFNLSITMDGLSGMKIYSKFIVDASYLPSNYPNNVEFLIKGINHEIADNKWTTKLESFCISIGNFEDTTLDGTTQVTDTSTTSTTNEGTVSSLGFVKTLTSGFDLSKGSFKQRETTKTQIFLHHTAGVQKADKGKSVVDTYNQRTQDKNPASTHAVIDKDGHIEYLFDDKFISYHAGTSSPYISNTIGLSVELMAYGCLTKKTDGKFYNAYGGVIPPDQVALAVDINGNPKPYKGFAYYHKYTPQQISATKTLIKHWASKHNIPIKWMGQKSFDNMFPAKGTVSKDAINTPGLYTHNSVRTDKTDVFPQKELIDMFKTL